MFQWLAVGERSKELPLVKLIQGRKRGKSKKGKRGRIVTQQMGGKATRGKKRRMKIMIRTDSQRAIKEPRDRETYRYMDGDRERVHGRGMEGRIDRFQRKWDYFSAGTLVPGTVYSDEEKERNDGRKD